MTSIRFGWSAVGVILWVLTVRFAAALPQAPTQVLVETGDASITVAWKPVEGATGYNVKRSTTIAGPATTIATNTTALMWQDAQLRNGTGLFYSISAIDPEGEGPESKRLRAIPSTNFFGLPAGAKIERLALGFQFTEGPVWLPQGYLILSDIPANRLYKWSSTEGRSIFRANSGQANGNTLDRQGRLISGEHVNRRISRTELDGTVVPLVTNYNGRRFNAPNDVAVKSDGTIWFTDPNYGVGQLQPGRWVYRFHPDDPAGTLITVATNFDQPNGIVFSPDEKKLYVSDSGTPHHIRVFDVTSENTLTNSKVFAVINPGAPDGMRVHPDGRLFTSAGDGVQIFSPEGRLLEKILTPETAANLAFGGAEGEMLFITAGTTLYAVTRQPDLVLTAIYRFPNVPAPGQDLRFICAVKNQGTGMMGSNVRARLAFSSATQTNALISDPLPELRPDASILLVIPPLGQPGWRATSGTHPVNIVVDFENSLIESNERNNQTNITIVVPEAAADTDSDFLLDSEETIAGTDPSNPDSVLRILGFSKNGDGFYTLRWQSQAGKEYRISTKKSLKDLEWIDYPQVIPGLVQATTWTNSGQVPALFRVKTQ